MNLKGTIVFTVVTAVCVGAASVIYLRWQEFAPMAGWVHCPTASRTGPKDAGQRGPVNSGQGRRQTGIHSRPSKRSAGVTTTAPAAQRSREAIMRRHRRRHAMLPDPGAQRQRPA